MQHTKLSRLMAAFLLIAVFASACVTNQTPQTNEATQAVEAAQQTLTAMPTATPFVPSTDTPTPEPTATSTTAPTAVPTLGAVGPTGFPENVNPLTGQVVSDPTLLDRSPLLIKVSNYPAIGRPHAGLSAADIVFEYFTGEGTNRFMALYYGQNAPAVGPIRSARLVDAQLVPMYSGILGFAYADPKVYARVTGALGDQYFLPGGNNCAAICDDGRNTVISVFAYPEKMTELAKARGLDNGERPNLDGMAFDPTPPQGGQPGEDALVQYSWYNRGQWIYDQESGTYLRWIESVDANNNVTMVELPDKNTDEQLGFSNVAILFGMYIEYAPTLHDITVTSNLGGQRAVIFRDGQAYDVVWKSQGANLPLAFYTADGQPFPLKPGNTWMAFMGTYTQTKQPEAGKWEFLFNLP